MGESLNQPCRVRDEGPTGLKPLLRRDKVGDLSSIAGTARIRIG